MTITNKKESSERVLLFATYTILYLNDLICNEVKAIEPILRDKDKETKKIYGALLKRSKTYLKDINSVIGDKVYYYAEYCSAIDDVCDDKVQALKDVLRNTLKINNVNEGDFIASIEAVRLIIDMCISTEKELVRQSLEHTPLAKRLESYILSDFKKIADNLISWVTIYYKTPKNIDGNKHGVKDKLDDLHKVLIDYESFYSAYTIASQYEDVKYE